MSEDRSGNSPQHCFPLSPALIIEDPDFAYHFTAPPPLALQFDASPFSDDASLFLQFAVSKFQRDDDNLENSFVKPSYFTSPFPEALSELEPDHDPDEGASPRTQAVRRRQRAIAKPRPPGKPLSPSKIKIKGCGCQTSNCLRRYCKCFSARGYCYEGCGCVDCFNTPEYETERQLVIEKTQEICRGSFAPKILQTYKGARINAEGCRCKSGCRSKHCVCSKNGVGCSPICRCAACGNAKVDLEPEEVRKYFRLPLRTKERLLISSTTQGSTDDKSQEVNSPVFGKKTTVVFFAKADAETRISQLPQ